MSNGAQPAITSTRSPMGTGTGPAAVGGIDAARGGAEALPGNVSDEFKRFADRSCDVVYRYDLLARRYLFWNKVGLLTYGEKGGVSYPTSETVLDMVLPEDRERIRRVSRASMLSRQKQGEVEYRIRQRDGAIRWMHDRWIVICDPQGRAVAIEGVVRDTTDARRTVEELRESRENYRRLVETMNDGLVVADAEERFHYVNQRFCEMLGYAQEELVDASVVDFVTEDDRANLLRQCSRRTFGARDPYEICWLSKGGEDIPTIVSPEPIFDANGQFEGSFAVVTDISEQKRIQRVLGEREKELEANKRHLEDVIRALSALLDKRDADRSRVQASLEQHVRQSMEPYLNKLKMTPLNEHQRVLVSIVESGLEEFSSPGQDGEWEQSDRLTAAESQVAKLVRIGKSTKEIAGVLNLSTRTVESHRYNIRKKLGMRHTGQALRTKLAHIAGPAPNPVGDWVQQLEIS